MFRRYGFLGLLLIVFAEITMFLRMEPYATYFIPFVWFGYIFLIDSMVYMLKGSSLIVDKPKKFILILVLSFFVWSMFEYFNSFIENWYYIHESTWLEPNWSRQLRTFLSFSTIMPAIFETADFIRHFYFFGKLRPNIQIHPTHKMLTTLILFGVLLLLLPVYYPQYFFGAVWISIILIIEPILFLNDDEKSILFQMKKKKYNEILPIFFAGYACGALWEFWNYWANIKWIYTVPLPILQNVKIFEMPILGYSAYGFFALELYVIYHFTKMLFSGRLLKNGVAGI